MENHEQNFNYALGAVLQKQRRGWKNKVKTEMNGSVVGGGMRPGRADNLIYADEMQPVVVEAAFEKTPDVDGDAISRLGRQDGKNKLEIMTAVALAIPPSVKKIKGGVDGVRKWLEKGGKLKYAVYSLVKEESGEMPERGYDVRYPDGKRNGGYISGTAADLADLIELAATPDKRIKQVAEQVSGVVHGVAGLLHDTVPEIVRKKIARKVGQPPDIHAMRVAACIWLNALVLHGKLAAALPDKIAAPDECKNWRDMVDEWKNILEIDYKSVFYPALESLEMLSAYAYAVDDILARLSRQAHDINALRLGAAADISSDIFPKLATDRKVTAAYYTLPEVAELLAGMAFNLIPETDADIKIGDFACGTGALLKAAYRHVRRRAEPKHKMELLHKRYMENCLHGADIQPIAAHLTAAGLAGMNPGASYEYSNIICADVRGGKTGSLDLIKSESLVDLFGSSLAKSADRGGVKGFRSADNSFDLCIMNPPYSRPHGGRKIFGVKGLPDYQRAKSSANLGKYLSGSFANKKAGMASAFCFLADKKLRAGGILAAVLPLTAAAQTSWRLFRSRMLNHYSDAVVVGMASERPGSFSADTGMGEMLFCARKNGGNGGGLTVINLHRLPRDFVEAHEIARALRGVQHMKSSSELRIGGHVFATCIKLNPQNGDVWGGVGAKSWEIAGVAKKIIGGLLTFPGVSGEFKFNVPVDAASNHMEIGPGEDEIGRREGSKERRGAFHFYPIQRGDKSDLSLWNADYKIQTRLICNPTYKGIMNEEKEAQAEEMRNKKSVLFIARNLRLTSQKLASAMTKIPCMGGSAWAGLSFEESSVYAAYCLWFNSIFGLLAMWECGGKQHAGKARMTISDIKKFPCPIFSGKTAAAKKAVKIANKEFLRLTELHLMPCSYAWRDENRKKIDKVVLRMLGLENKFTEENMQALREAWGKEPSVHGGNKLIRKALHADGLI